jgi:hypothetical protein
MMYDTDWVKFYSDWTLPQLFQEVETCHKYQLELVARLYNKSIGLPQAINQITLSQHREALIHEAIRGKDV